MAVHLKHTTLTSNVVEFCRILRSSRLFVGPLDESNALLAVEKIDIGNREDFRFALRITLAKSLNDQKIFDDIFYNFWSGSGNWTQTKKHGAEERKDTTKTDDIETKPDDVYFNYWTENQESTSNTTDLPVYSPNETLIHKDFSKIEFDELGEVITIITTLAKIIANKISHRYKPSNSSNIIDLRKTMRNNLHRGGELIDLALKQRRIQRLKLVMICDVSQSMDVYSRLLIQFIYAFQNVYRQIETFVFSTSLYRMTNILKGKKFNDVLREIKANITGWSGGTRIGDSLNTFLKEYGLKMLDKNTIVLIMSDGWDTGEIEKLKKCISDIHKRISCLIWLNPLMGSPVYEPTCRGMLAALPYIDILAPVHNLKSLRDLSRHLLRTQVRSANIHRYTAYLKKHYVSDISD